MINMIKLILPLLLMFSTLHAQVKVTGKVVDPADKPIEFAEIILLNQDSVAFMSELADENGAFILTVDKGNYILQIRQVSQIFHERDLAADQDIDLGTIKAQNGLDLDEVLVTAKMKLISRKIDRTVFNVENSSSASQGDALEVLKITPGIRVDNDQVAMIGKSNVSVMIDDRIIELRKEELSDFLRSIPSDDIMSIEVITTPPATLGNSGLVNIKLKKAKENSWNAMVGSSYVRKTYNGGSGMANFNYNKNKLSIASSLSLGKGATFHTQDDYAYFPDAIWYSSSPFKLDAERFSGRVNLGYQLTNKWNTGIQYLFNTSNRLATDTPYTSATDYETGELHRYLQSAGANDQNPQLHSVNWFNAYDIDTLGRKVSVSLDYFNYSNEDSKTYDGISVIEEPRQEQYFGGININAQNIVNFSGKIDFDIPLDWMTLGVGGKVSSSQSTNNITAYNSGFVENKVTDYPTATTGFEYTENIQAAYISTNKKINEKWETQLGLRMEATQTETFTDGWELPEGNDYVKFFPTAYVSFIPNENNVFNLNYSRRIERPRFNDLNPNIWFINPFQSIEGNPFLQPAFIDNVEFSHTYKGLSSKVYFSFEKDLFNQIPLTDPDDNTIRYTNANYIDTRRIGISENYTFDKVKWWTSNNSVDLNYAISDSNLDFTVDRQTGLNARVSSFNDFALNSSRTLLLNLGFWYSFPSIDGIYKLKSMNNLSAGIQYMLLDKRLRISLKGRDLLKKQAFQVGSVVNDVVLDGVYYHDARSLTFSINYKFGNQNIRVRRQAAGNEEERRRAGG